MPIIVFGDSSNIQENKNDTGLLVQKPYLRTNFIETNIEENIDLKNQKESKKYLMLLVFQKQLQKIMLIIYSKLLLISMMLTYKK